MTDREAIPTSESTRQRRYGDSPLNYYQDQVPDIKPQLRRIELELAQEAALEVVETPTTAVLLGFAVMALAKRKFLLASLFGAGILLQQVLTGPRRDAGGNGARRRRRAGLEVERYALKARRGDYGKLDVIAFK